MQHARPFTRRSLLGAAAVAAASALALTGCVAGEGSSGQAAAAGLAAPAPGPPLNLWALAGRSEAMQLRLLMQRRSLR